ncbi:Metalloprotease [Amylocystis lapponica]|nr:Metalloprotease [Amylocystis lapponica]
MAEPREARPSTDEETAPLLQNGGSQEPASPTFSERISSIVQEPLTPLTKVLLVVVIVFLLLSSVFIGLFAGAQHRLNSGGGGGNGDKAPVSTVTVTATATATATTTATSTNVHTSTLPPVPVPTSPPIEPACLTPDCIILASSILSSLDLTQDPCENFYQYANGGWLKAHPLPSDKGAFGNFEALAQQNRRVLQEILSPSSSISSDVSLDSYDAQLQKKLRGLYSSCMNEDLLNDLGTEPLAKVTRNVRSLFQGETTIVDDLTARKRGEKNTNLTAAISYLHSRGLKVLFEPQIEGDVGTDPNFMTLWVSQPSLGLPAKEYYEEESFVELYQNVLERLLITLAEEEENLAQKTTSDVYEERLRVWPPWPWPPWGGDDDDDKPDEPVDQKKKAHKLSKKIIKLEKAIANASLDLDILYQDPVATYNPIPIENLTSALPQIDFGAYLASFTPRNYPSTVILTSTTYPASLSAILDETSPETIEAYLVARTGLALAPFLGMETEAWKAVRSLDEQLRGLKKGAVGDRAEYCISQVEGAMGFAAGRYFVNETFGGKSREKGTKIITDIVKSFKDSLSHIEWMDEESAAAAAQKADAIRVKVGFPTSPNTLDPRSLATYYYLVKIQDDTFFDNMLSASISEEYGMWQKLGKQRNLDEWEMYPSMVNAYFNPPANEIVFPAGILQPPFFAQDWPGYLSYGSFGQVASHELTHAFDSAGRLYNQQGKLEQWWTNATSDGFKVKQDCIVKQYSAYTIDDGKGGKIHVNGNLTSGENIGDTGIIQAYRAWKTQYDESLKDGTEYLLPGLPYTREQLFFISFARAWARNIKPASAVARVRTDPHSPNQYRVDGTLFNLPEFAAAFKCSAKSKLNPPQEERCIFW